MFKIYRYLFFTLFIVISLMTGCNKDVVSEPSKSVESKTTQIDENKSYVIKNATPIHLKVRDQEFEIIPVFNPILEYIQKVKDNSEEGHKELFLSTVVEPFRKEAFGEKGGLGLKDKFTFAAPINIERLNESIQILDKDYEHIVSILKQVLEKSSAKLPTRKTTIYLFPFNPDQRNLINQMSGVTAFATNNQIIVLHISPQEYKEAMLKYAIAHEYHHIVHFNHNEIQKRDIVDYVLSEGKADSFANIIIPDVEIPWTRELTSDEEQNIWNWLKERRYTFNEKDLGELRNGNNIFSYWSDYRIGYQIMQEFIKNNPDVPLSEWTFMDSENILEKSGFNGK